MLPIGIEDFKELITEEFYYIDKTGLIRELLNDWAKVTLFTRPRRFGKSLNMSMLRHFFEIGTNPTLFDTLEISHSPELCDTYLGKFPVIAISLKDVTGSHIDDACSALSNVIRTEALRHQYLMQSTQLSDYDKRELEPLLIGTMRPDTLVQSLGLLSRMLQKHYNQKVIILIDEYDVPLAKAYDYGYYDAMVIYIRNLLHQTLKTNESLQFAILTGCMRIAKESIFTGLNNLNIISLTNAYFDEYFGFTDKEVTALLDYYDLTSKHQTVKTWYDGYQFGNQSVYCPWDVLKYIFDQRKNPNMPPQNYWANTSSNDIIRKLLNKATTTTRHELEHLVEGQVIEKEIYPELTYAELDKTVNHLWSVLFTTGYLTYEPFKLTQINDDSNVFCSNKLQLKIPNAEIRSIFKDQILAWFNSYVETDANRYMCFCQAFIDGDVPKIQDMFNAYLKEMISIRDTSVRTSMKENFYHGILLGILNYRTDWYVTSNQESGEGYHDIMIVHDDTRCGIIIEVKYANNDNLEAECATALKQINQLHYTDGFKQYETEKIFKYAIACYKKHCKVVMEEE